jgi:hypothetical protein
MFKSFFILLIFSDDEDSIIRTKSELRASIDKALPALPEIDAPYFEYMFSDAEFGQQNEEDEEGQIASIEEDSRKFHFHFPVC